MRHSPANVPFASQNYPDSPANSAGPGSDGVPDRDQRVAAMHKSLIRPHSYAGPHVAGPAASQFDTKAGPVLPFPGILSTRHPTLDSQIGLNRSLGNLRARTVP